MQSRFMGVPAMTRHNGEVRERLRTSPNHPSRAVWDVPSETLKFWAKVDFDGPAPKHNPELGACWLWKDHLVGGYGQYRTVRGMRAAHRHAYRLCVGPIPRGYTLDHLCRNTACVRPAHLEPVTLRDNILRGNGPTAQNARKTHCPRGHAYNKANTYYWKRPGGGLDRICRACRRKGGYLWQRARSRHV